MRIHRAVHALGIFLASTILAASAQTTAPRLNEKRISTAVEAIPDSRKESVTRSRSDQGAIENQKLRAPSILTSRIPDVVGLSSTDAKDALIQAGLTFEMVKFIYDDQPDPSVPYGHVRSVIPAVGTPLVSVEEVELHIPRAASVLGIAVLGPNDVERRDGFDLDEGHYEEILRGADMVLRKHENKPQTDENGNIYYVGAGLYAEPSDGAILIAIRGGVDYHGLGSFNDYVNCQSELKKSRRQAIKIDGETVFCVLTAKHEMAMVEFRSADIGTDYKFHYALFPRQLLLSVDLLKHVAK